MKTKHAIIVLAVLTWLADVYSVKAQRVFPQGIAVSGSYVEGVGYIDPTGWGVTFADPIVRSMAPSIAQLGGIDPVSGTPITDSNNLLVLVPRALVTDAIQARQANGLWLLDALGSPVALISNGVLYANGAGLTNLSSDALNERDPVFSASAAAGITSTTMSQWQAAYEWGNHAAADYIRSVSAVDPLSSTGGQMPAISITQASASRGGYLASNDWNAFNSKLGGGGSAGYVPKFTSDAAVGNSLIFESTGRIGIKTTSPAADLHVNGRAQVANLMITGEAFVASDENLAKDLGKVSDALSRIASLTGYFFHKTHENSQTRKAGVKAKEVESVLPEAVASDAVGHKAVDYNQLTALLINAVKELKAENTALKARTDAQAEITKGLLRRLEHLERTRTVQK